jgi:transposase
MEIDVEDLARRLVVGRKRDGRGIYDAGAKRELIELCQRPGISVARLARDVGVNANLLASWLRGRGLKGAEIVEAAPTSDRPPAAFVALHLESGLSAVPVAPEPPSLQARLPNGVVIDLQCDDLQQLGKLIEALGRVRCSASTKT